MTELIDDAQMMESDDDVTREIGSASVNGCKSRGKSKVRSARTDVALRGPGKGEVSLFHES